MLCCRARASALRAAERAPVQGTHALEAQERRPARLLAPQRAQQTRRAHAHELHSQRARVVLKVCFRPVVVLEVGAGDGRLSHFLGEELAGDERVTVVATDSGRQRRGRCIAGALCALSPPRHTRIILVYLPFLVVTIFFLATNAVQ